MSCKWNVDNEIYYFFLGKGMIFDKSNEWNILQNKYGNNNWLGI